VARDARRLADPRRHDRRAAAAFEKRGRMTAYDLNRGEIAWQVPTGAGPDGVGNHPALKDVKLPLLGGLGTPMTYLADGRQFWRSPHSTEN
jgi:hypothetical protein